MSSVSIPSLWEEIERSESYLVCCMFEEAASSAFSILKQVSLIESTESSYIEVYELMECAGMVLVQSWRELGRAVKILDELKVLFGAVTLIPVSVLLAGTSFQLAEGGSSGIREFLEAFLLNWNYVNERYYVLVDGRCASNNNRHVVLSVDKYLEVVEAYVSFLVKVLDDINLAYICIEKLALPDDTRQRLLGRLHSFCCLKATNLANGGINTSPGDKDEAFSSAAKKSKASDDSSKILERKLGTHGIIFGVLDFSRRIDLFVSWFLRTITLKFGKYQFVVSNGKLVMSCVIFFAYYVIRRKQVAFKRIVWRLIMLMKKGLGDLWQLAFSYQLDPLAATALTTASRGSR